MGQRVRLSLPIPHLTVRCSGVMHTGLWQRWLTSKEASSILYLLGARLELHGDTSLALKARMDSVVHTNTFFFINTRNKVFGGQKYALVVTLRLTILWSSPAGAFGGRTCSMKISQPVANIFHIWFRERNTSMQRNLGRTIIACWD